MLFIGFLAQNLAIGTTYGAIGLLLEPISKELGAGRSTLSLAIAMIALVFGLSGPLVGQLLDRWSVRYTMLIGSLCGAAGFTLAAMATSASLYLLAFGLMVGFAFTLMGVMPANKIATAWFPEQLGRASGIVNLPVLNALAPLVFGYLLVELGWRHLHQLIGLSFLAMAVLTLFVAMPPKTAAAAAGVAATPQQTAPFRLPIFWLIALISGLLNSSGIVAVTHAASYAIDNGATVHQGALLMSVLGFTSIIGAFAGGWLCDRIGAVVTLSLNATLQTLLWLAIISMPDFNRLLPVAALLSICTGGVFPVTMVLLGRVFPAHQFGAAFGQLTFALIPFNFGAAPVAGLLFDRFGNYAWAFSLEALLCALALTGLLLGRGLFRRTPVSAGAAVRA